MMFPQVNVCSGAEAFYDIAQTLAWNEGWGSKRCSVCSPKQMSAVQQTFDESLTYTQENKASFVQL